MIRAIQFQNKRVGSTFLQKALDSHPLISGIDEVFVNVARKQGMKKSGYIPYVRSDYNSAEAYIRNLIWDQKKHVIFKLMYNQIHYHPGLFAFIQNSKIPMIHVMRKNLVKQVISGQNAATTQHDQIGIQPEMLFQLVSQADQLNKDWRKQITWKKLELFYEDIIGDSIDGFTFVSESVRMSLSEFFGIEVPILQKWFCAATKKKNKNDIWVYLKDREGVEKRFKGTPYEWMIK